MLQLLILLSFAHLQVSSSLMNQSQSSDQNFEFKKDFEEKLHLPNKELRVCAKGESICIPANYSKFDLPNEDETTQVSVGIDIKDIPNINDHEFSVTLNAFFVVRFVQANLFVRKCFASISTFIRCTKNTVFLFLMGSSFLKIKLNFISRGCNRQDLFIIEKIR